MNVINVLLVGAGGCIGSMARYLTVISIDKKLNSLMPFGTMAVNILGSFILGFLLAIVSRKTGVNSQEWKLFVGTGFCGGFTTFSAFALENINLMEHRSIGISLLYIFLSLVLGMLAVWVGLVLGKNYL